MSINDILHSYESVDSAETACFQYWYFVNDTKTVRRECNDRKFIIELLSSSTPRDHHWYICGNFHRMTIMPYLPYIDYRGMNSELFNFGHENRYSIYGDYIVWPTVSAHFLGWLLYLYLNCDYKLSLKIPLIYHANLGAVNLLTSSDTNLDISCRITFEGKTIFTNTRLETKYRVMDLKGVDGMEIGFGKHYTNTKAYVWFDRLLYDDRVAECVFLPEFRFLGDSVNFDRLRWASPPSSSRERTVAKKTSYVSNPSPASQFEEEFKKYIDESLDTVNYQMVEKLASANPEILKFYLEQNGYATFYILAIGVWQYCESVMSMHNMYKVEDVLYFMEELCKKVGGGDSIYHDHIIYISSKNMAQNFFNSLQFFVLPDQGIEAFFDGISSYYALHYSIFAKTESWTITNSTVLQCDTTPEIKCSGYFKKLKITKSEYIFNGHVYEHFKNRKDHPLACLFEDCPEITVSSLMFNKTLNFYLTQEGMFDVCKKIYREPCPFIVQSTLKKNFITKDQQYLKEDTFESLYNSTQNDLLLFKMYHARKFLQDFDTLMQNLKDCRVNIRMAHRKDVLEDRLRGLIQWLLEYKASDLILLLMRMNVHRICTNVLAAKIQMDVMGLQVAVVCQLLWPSTFLSCYFVGLLMPFFEELKEWVEEWEDDALVVESMFENRKKIIEAMHRYLQSVSFDGYDIIENDVRNMLLGLGPRDKKKYPHQRVIPNITAEYKKYKKLPERCNVWNDRLIEYKEKEDMYTWLTRFYIRMFLKDCDEEENMLQNVVKGFAYFRVFTNFHTNNSKALMNFCASLAVPVDNEKMCIVLSSKPNCGKSSLWELLSKIILVYKQDKEEYKFNKNDKDEKVKMLESQLYVMNEAHIFTKAFLKSTIDSTKVDSARCIYGVVDMYYSTFKVLICNNENDKIYVKDGYDKACSNRIGQMYFDHIFDPELPGFSGSVYEHHIKKVYCEIRDVNSKLISSVQQLLANVLKYNSDPSNGYLYYKSILQNDNSYKHNKKCLYIFNCRLDALLYVLNVREDKNGAGCSSAEVTDAIKAAEKYVSQMVHPGRRNAVTFDGLCSDFKQKYQKGRFYNFDTDCYMNLSIVIKEQFFRQFPPRFKSNVDETL
ncbi:helicase-1 [Plodia interpunctella granulovirus]|uniref:Helicase-1 n=1 Tax=Plodia interpunctella granulovirus TaxID=262175 RepID=A0A1L5JGP6_9BBAC|nr:helicase-1 [Plodia interpunctella granulovirus]APO13961.1 helicase-1 [Plodia interpunctella granulovirus]